MKLLVVTTCIEMREVPDMHPIAPILKEDYLQILKDELYKEMRNIKGDEAELSVVVREIK